MRESTLSPRPPDEQTPRTHSCAACRESKPYIRFTPRGHYFEAGQIVDPEFAESCDRSGENMIESFNAALAGAERRGVSLDKVIRERDPMAAREAEARARFLHDLVRVQP